MAIRKAKPKTRAASTRTVRTERSAAVKAEGFVVEIMREGERLRSTGVLHVKSNLSDRWDGFNEKRLAAFIRKHAGITAVPVRSPKRKLAVVAAPAPQPAPRASVAVPVNFEILDAGLRHRQMSRGQPMGLELALRAGTRSRSAPYQATIFVRHSDDAKLVSLSQSSGTLQAPEGKVSIEVSAQAMSALRPGLYFVTASVESPAGGRGDSASAGMVEVA